MIDFNSVELKNFRSFVGAHAFRFDREPGLYQINGPNGCGKSSFIMEAPYWALYGKTTRNLKAGNVHSWNQKGSTNVTLNLTVDDKDYCIERQWRPNKLLLNGETVDESAIENLIKLNSESFKYSVFTPQFGQSFFDLKPAEKLQLFSSLLDLDYWITASKKAQTQEKRLQAEINAKREDQRYKEGRAETLIEQAEDYEKQLDRFDQDKDKKVRECQKELDEVDGKIKQYEKQIKELEADNKELKKEQQSIKINYEKLEPNLEKLSEQCSELEEELVEVRGESRNLNSQIKKFEDLGDTCPACEQKITTTHLDKHLKPLKKQKSILNKEEQWLEDEIEKISEKYESIHQDYDKYMADEANIINKTQENTDQISELGGRVRVEERSRKNTEKVLSDNQSEENPYVSLLDDTADKIETLYAETEEIEKELNELEAEATAVSYWVQGFKELRLFVVEDVLTHLEVQVNNHIHDLGLEDWAIRFDVEKENKTGGVSRGFHILISTPTSQEPVPIETFSGGESMRLRLACMLGLADLIFQSYGLNSNVLVLDEVTTHLNKQGIQQLLELLHGKAVEEGKQIYIIDHHSHDYPFDGIIEIQKGSKGSEIRAD